MADSQRDKLVELILNAPKILCIKGGQATGKQYQTFQNIADHLLANGVIAPPCKVGDIVYVKYSGAIEYFVISKVIHNGSNSFDFEADLENEDGYTIASIEFGTVEIGRTVFLTKEEAEEKLKELGK